MQRDIVREGYTHLFRGNETIVHGRSVNKDNYCCISRIYQSFSHG